MLVLLFSNTLQGLPTHIPHCTILWNHSKIYGTLKTFVKQLQPTYGSLFLAYKLLTVWSTVSSTKYLRYQYRSATVYVFQLCLLCLSTSTS